MKTLLRWPLAVIGGTLILYSGRALLEIVGIEASLRQEEDFEVQAFGLELTPTSYALTHSILFVAGAGLVISWLRAGKEKTPNKTPQTIGLTKPQHED